MQYYFQNLGKSMKKLLITLIFTFQIYCAQQNDNDELLTFDNPKSLNEFKIPEYRELYAEPRTMRDQFLYYLSYYVDHYKANRKKSYYIIENLYLIFESKKNEYLKPELIEKLKKFQPIIIDILRESINCKKWHNNRLIKCICGYQCNCKVKVKINNFEALNLKIFQKMLKFFTKDYDISIHDRLMSRHEREERSNTVY